MLPYWYTEFHDEYFKKLNLQTRNATGSRRVEVLQRHAYFARNYIEAVLEEQAKRIKIDGNYKDLAERVTALERRAP